ncbi:hypothetical protein LJR186_001226 [Microbacterium foliorum]
MARVQVTAAVAVLPTVDGREQYLYQGSIVDDDAFTAEGIEHARAQGLIGDAPEFVEEEPVAVFSQDEVDAAVKDATEAQGVELSKALADLAAAQTELAAAQAELSKKSAPAVKQTPAKS